ncbi:hypothetical protein PTSG_04425 [Salpingoeca rosetta]|uniref:NADH dehydrogenase [ubiquinone] 1 alpha subcomplex subunit 12 n=1 Tax=Salpingoeca rosetta (strain ATCC 50818 / BSB-021) TaxID=946362 RepID=F2U8I8_SALR5|nr:uncharacterized protein PTSG_04425 [Salpingoeca rosetta]EGD72696.1 hypothetical protein PTSG_04425 [Salpingoeca rosetta]|eukprot:XP_004994519.1 hypothetical protein PTSG_04425 [Salpingoeca rosetta]
MSVNVNNFSTVMKLIQRVGWKQVARDLMREGKVMPGTLVGVDKLGNRYYEDRTQMFGQHRRVDYASSQPDGSQIPGEWHRWMHYMTDDLPNSEEPLKKWQAMHTENYTGTTKQYVPYSTTKPKIEAWKPQQ